MDAATVVACVVTVVAAAADRRGLTGHPLLAGDPVGSQTVVAVPARVTATVDAGPVQRLRVAEAKDLQRAAHGGRPSGPGGWIGWLHCRSLAWADW